MNHIHNPIWAIVLQQDGLSTTTSQTDPLMEKGEDNNDLCALRKSQPPQGWGVNLHKAYLENLLYS